MGVGIPRIMNVALARVVNIVRNTLYALYATSHQISGPVDRLAYKKII